MVPEAVTAAQRRLYKASVPEGWRIVHLADIFEQVVDTGHKADLPVLSVTVDGQIIRRSLLDRKFGRVVQRDKYLRVKPGDIAYNTMRMWQGASGLVKEEGYISPAYTVCRPREGECPEFWATYFQYEPMIRAFRDHSQGFAKDRYRLYFPYFGTIAALRPPASEQQGIVAALSPIDETIEKTETVIEQLHVTKQATMQELLARGLPGRHNNFKKTEIGTVPQAWKVKLLGEVCKLAAGGTPSRSEPRFWNGSIPWVKTGEVNFKEICKTEECISEAGLKRSAAKLLPVGTVLLAMYGQGKTRGRVAILGVEAAVNQACLGFLNHGSLYNKFLFHVLSWSYDRLRRIGNEGSQKNLSATLVAGVPIPIPDLDEQREISYILDTLTSRISIEMTALSALINLRSTLINALLSGEVRVKSEGAS